MHSVILAVIDGDLYGINLFRLAWRLNRHIRNNCCRPEITVCRPTMKRSSQFLCLLASRRKFVRCVDPDVGNSAVSCEHPTKGVEFSVLLEHLLREDQHLLHEDF